MGRKRSKSSFEETEKMRKKSKNDKPKTPRQKSRQSRAYSKTKQMHEQQLQMAASQDWDDEEDQKENQTDDDFFGNAPERSKKRKKKKSTDSGLCFDTFLDNIESDKLKITKEGRMVSMDYFTDSLYVISSTGFSSGKHEWELKVLKTG